MTGVDICEDAISYATDVATQKKVSDKLTYIVGDVADLDFSENVFDSIVCIETIEHLDGLEQCEAMEGFLRMMKKDGNLLITTPIDDGKSINKFHKKEFTEREFDMFLTTYFSKVFYHDPFAYGINADCRFIMAECKGPLK